MVNIKKKIVTLKDRIIYNIGRPEMRVLPGSLAFFFFLTLIPLFALLIYFVSIFNLPYSSLSNIFSEYFPKGVINILEAINVKIDLNVNIIVFIISAMILASNGTHSMILVSNQIYRIKDRGYFTRRIKALIMMIVVVALLLFILFIPVFGNMIFKLIFITDRTSTLKSILLSIYSILKYPISFIIIYTFVRLLYIMAPDKRIRRESIEYGTLFTTVSWIFLTKIYSVYVENFTNYTTFYGGVASILILMLWLYFLSYIFVLGMALNVSRDEIIELKKNND